MNAVQMREALRSKLENVNVSERTEKPDCTPSGCSSAAGRSNRRFTNGSSRTTMRRSAPGPSAPRETSAKSPTAIRERVVALARDPSRDVQLQVAIASRKIEGCDALPVLVGRASPLRQRQSDPGHRLAKPSSAAGNRKRPVSGFVARFETSPGPHRVSGRQRSRAHWPSRRCMPRFIERILNARQPDAAAVAALLEYAAEHTHDRAPECIAAISANLAGLNDAQRRRVEAATSPGDRKTCERPALRRLPFERAAARGTAGSGRRSTRRKCGKNSSPTPSRNPCGSKPWKP